MTFDVIRLIAKQSHSRCIRDVTFAVKTFIPITLSRMMGFLTIGF